MTSGDDNSSTLYSDPASSPDPESVLRFWNESVLEHLVLHEVNPPPSTTASSPLHVDFPSSCFSHPQPEGNLASQFSQPLPLDFPASFPTNSQSPGNHASQSKQPLPSAFLSPSSSNPGNADSNYRIDEIYHKFSGVEIEEEIHKKGALACQQQLRIGGGGNAAFAKSGGAGLDQQHIIGEGVSGSHTLGFTAQQRTRGEGGRVPPTLSGGGQIEQGSNGGFFVSAQPQIGNSSSADETSNSILTPEEQSNQSNCSYCQVLRTVLHASATQTSRIEVHGVHGVIYHAIVQFQTAFGNGQVNREHHLVDFTEHGYESVKQFLLGYGALRRQEGMAMVFDSLSDFYKTLCAPMDGDDGGSYYLQVAALERQLGAQQQPLLRTQPYGQFEGESRPVKPEESISSTPTFVKKTNVAVQRERTVKMKLNDFAPYFHLPITRAAKMLDICPTVLKKICRKFGMKRWPYRKLRSIDKNLANLKQDLSANKGRGTETASIKFEIQKLKQERVQVCCGLAVSNSAYT